MARCITNKGEEDDSAAERGKIEQIDLGGNRDGETSCRSGLRADLRVRLVELWCCLIRCSDLKGSADLSGAKRGILNVMVPPSTRGDSPPAEGEKRNLCRSTKDVGCSWMLKRERKSCSRDTWACKDMEGC